MKTLTVSENVLAYLKGSIITGELPPGQKLSEMKLASTLGVSTAPIREALRLLEKEHLVKSTPRKGCFVSEISLEDCRQIFKVRQTLELCTIDLLKEKGIKDLSDVSAALESSSTLPDASLEEQEKRMRVHNPFPDFHIKLVESTGNAWLANLYMSIIPTLSRYQFMSYVPSLLKKNFDEHMKILKLVQQARYKEAKRVLVAHIHSMFQRIERKMSAPSS